MPYKITKVVARTLHLHYFIILLLFTVILPWPGSSKAVSHARALVVAAGDFDEDGLPDLIAATQVSGGGLLDLRRGRLEAVYPRAAVPSSELPNDRATAGEPFLTPIVVSSLEVAPDWLGTGDFDADGHLDVVLAARYGRAIAL